MGHPPIRRDKPEPPAPKAKQQVKRLRLHGSPLHRGTAQPGNQDILDRLQDVLIAGWGSVLLFVILVIAIVLLLLILLMELFFTPILAILISAIAPHPGASPLHTLGLLLLALGVLALLALVVILFRSEQPAPGKVNHMTHDDSQQHKPPDDGNAKQQPATMRDEKGTQPPSADTGQVKAVRTEEHRSPTAIRQHAPVVAPGTGQAQPPAQPLVQPTKSPAANPKLSPTSEVMNAPLAGSKDDAQSSLDTARVQAGNAIEQTNEAAGDQQPPAAKVTGKLPPSPPPPPQRLVTSPPPNPRQEPVDVNKIEKQNPKNYAEEQHEHPHLLWMYTDANNEQMPIQRKYADKEDSENVPGSAMQRMENMAAADRRTIYNAGPNAPATNTRYGFFTDGWRAVGASRRGLGHEIDGLFREDDFDLALVGNRAMVVAIADGVGSKHLSRWGARAAVLGVTQAVQSSPNPSRNALYDLLREIEREPESGAARGCATASLFNCFQAARDAVKARADKEEIVVSELHSTLLVFIAVPYRNRMGEPLLFIASAQIGDGALFAGAFDRPDWRYLQKPQISGIDNQVLPLLRATDDDWQHSCDVKPAIHETIILGMTDGIDDDLGVSVVNGQPIPELTKFLQEHGITEAFAPTLSAKQAAETLKDRLGYRQRQSFDDRTLVAIYRPTSSAK